MSPTLLCAIDGKPVPENRARRKSFACVTCSDECYARFRLLRRELRREIRVYVPKRKWAAFKLWEAERSRVAQNGNQGQEGPLRTAQNEVYEEV